MKKEIAMQWVDELPKYVQARGRLKGFKEGFCCLGVLCEMAVKAGVIPPPVKDDPDWEGEFAYGGAKEIAILPIEVRAWAGMQSAGGGFCNQSTGHTFSLAALNDEGRDFAELACIIKDRWEEL
jgi:hypothetical protein